MIAAVIKWAFLAVAGIVITILAMILAPALALFRQADDRLPAWLSWFQQPDTPCCGDAAFHANQMSWTQSKYLWTVFWMWRNPAYGFDSAVLGARISWIWGYYSWGDELVGNSPLHNGWVFRKLVTGGHTYWQFYFVHGWTDTKCLRVNLGWKLWGDLQVGQVRSLVFSPNPWIACSI
jgi:hypothetical protein